MGSGKKVMVAIDGSEFSLYALKWTLQNLREVLKDSKLIIFTAQSVSDFGYLYVSSYGAARLRELHFLTKTNSAIELVRSVQENNNKIAKALLETAKAICSQHGVTADTITEVGDPKEVICEAVKKLEIELLVLGSQGRHALQRAFLGSVSNYCVHNAKCPVLVVKKNE